MLRTSLTALLRERIGLRPIRSCSWRFGSLLPLLALSAPLAAAPQDPTVEFTQDSSSGGEEAGGIVATLQLSATSSSDVEVPFAVEGTLDTSADGDIDQTSPVIIPAGDLSVDIVLTPVDDTLHEDDETLILTLGTPTGATLGANTVHTYTVVDDDAAPSVEFAALDQTGAEDAGTLTVDLNLSEVSGLDVSVPFTTSGAATEGDDYSLSANPLVIPAGDLGGTLTLTVTDDGMDEEDEDAVVTMGTPTGATLGATVKHTVTLTDDDDPPSVQFSSSGQSASEDGGAVPITATLSQVSGKQITVPFTVSGTAVDPDDYTLDATEYVISAGTLTFDVNATPVDDALDEADETVVLTLGTPTNATLGAQTGHTLVLEDQDDPPTVDFVTASSSVGEAEGSSTMTLQLSSVSGQDVTVPFTLAGTAVDPDDYGFDASPAVIPAGQATHDLTLTVVDDVLDEDDETVEVTLGNPTGADLGTTLVHTATLQDDDDPPAVEFALASDASGEADGSAALTVTLSDVSGLDVSVPYSVSGDAVDPDDFTIDPGPLLIPAGTTEGDVVLTIVDDALHENDELVQVDLGSPTNATLGSVASHAHTLQDDDDPPTVEFQEASQTVSEAAGSVPLTVVLSGPSGLDVTVPYTTAGTAKDPDDYQIDASPLVIPAGQTSGDIVVTTADDVMYEPNETVEVSLGSPTDGQLGSVTDHTLTLTSDDPPPTVDFQSTGQSAGEGAGTVTIELSLSAVSGTDVVVPLNLSGTATPDTDYTLDVDPVVIPAGMLTESTSVTPIPDSLDEEDETAVVEMDTPSGADLGTATTHTVTILDDDGPPTVRFQVAVQEAAEDAGLVPVTLVLSEVSEKDVTVPFTHKGNAEEGKDYLISGSPATILAGQTSTDILVTLLDDLEDEFNERIRVLMDTGALVNADPGSVVEHRLKIEDDDGLGTEFSVLGLRPDAWQLEYPTLDVGTTDGPQSVTLTNTQKEQSITFDGIDLQGPGVADYQISYGNQPPVELQPGESTSFDVTFAPGEYGVRRAVARVQQSPNGVPETRVQLRGIGRGLPGDELRMNVGPGDHLDTQGLYWSEDFASTGDSAFIVSEGEISGTEDDTLYQVARVGTAFGYSFELFDGEYDVVLHFAELEVSGIGQRVMDVSLEGTPVIQDLDLNDVAGSHAAWTSGTLRTTVTGGSLEVDLTATTGEALLSAIEIRSVPVIDASTTLVDFGVVEQGFPASEQVDLVNSGLANGHATQLAIVMDGDAKGTGEDFHVRIGQTDYHGGVSTVYYAIDLELPAGGSTPIEVFFDPTKHQENELRIELHGDYGSAEFDVKGTGGADADWGFLHPVLEYSPALLVDYDQDGTEAVDLFGDQSHTHEPGQSIASHEWSEAGVPFSSQPNTTRIVSLGTTTVELTITDDKDPADSATDDLDLELHAPESVPGILVSYYDGNGDPVFLLDNVPSQANHRERIDTLLVGDQDGQVGGSPFTGDVMVRWEASFDVSQRAMYEFLPTGGVLRRLFVDGKAWDNPTSLTTGEHQLEARFAVETLADLPLSLDVKIDGQQASGWADDLVHDERTVPPLIHGMPTVGSELGGNLIPIAGFGFFPEDQVTVHWGSMADFTSQDFVSWTDQEVVVTSPPGTGSVLVTVETPNGISNSFEFVYSPDGPIPVKFELLEDKQVHVPNPTTATWHPNGNLYVGTLNGFVFEVSFDESWSSTVTAHAGISNLTNHDLLGIAVNPYDPPDPVKLYVAHGEHFLNGGGSFEGPSPFTGQVSVLTGPDFDDPVPLITSLPTSNHDHGVNGLLFDNNGDLLVCVGGNTNAGVKWPLMGDVPGSPFSGAIVKARTSLPDFNGQIGYVARNTGSPVDDQVKGRNIDPDGQADVEVYASGFRNSYDLALTTRGLLYATDNGPNVNYGPASTGPSSNSGVHPQHDDELDLVREGNYYGHANRNRGDLDPRQHVWRDPSEPSDVDFTQQMYLMGSATCGLEEYRAQTFNGQLRGHLIAQKWNANQYLLELSEDGREVVDELVVNPLAKGLDVVPGPGGALIAIDYSGDALRILEPDDVSAVALTLHDIRPWRTTAAGGTPFTIGGEGFQPGQTSVTVGGFSCTVTSVTSRRIQGVFPPMPVNNIGSLYDAQVTVGADQVTLPACVLCMPIDPGQMKGFWVTGTSMPDPLGEVACAVVGRTLYVFGEGTTKTYAYDLLNDSWADDLAPRPFPGNHHACEVVDGKIYLIGGLGGGEGEVQIYDPDTDSWSSGAPMPWNGGSCSSAVIDGLIYVCGGIVGGTTVANLSVYDPALDEWDGGGSITLATMPTPVNHAAATTDGDKLWVFGGRQGGNWPQPGFDTVQCYDPGTDTWDSSDRVQSDLEPMPQGRGGTGKAVFLDGECYVFGGEDSSAVFDEVQVYRPATNTWRDEAEMPTARHGIFPVEFQKRIYVVAGGTNAGFSASDVMEIFRRP